MELEGKDSTAASPEGTDEEANATHSDQISADINQSDAHIHTCISRIKDTRTRLKPTFGFMYTEIRAKIVFNNDFEVVL